MIHSALVVDDSRTARFMLAKILQRLGVVTATANSAEEALDYLATHVPDAIFIDHVMPGLDGLHATRRIKADPRFANVPIVIFTAKEGDEYIAQARAHGAHSVLTKPPSDEYVQGLLDILGREVEHTRSTLPEEQPRTATAPPPLPDEGAVERAAQRVVDAALGAGFEARVEAQVARLVAAQLETVRAEMEVQHGVENARLDDLAAQAREAFERDSEAQGQGARAEALAEAIVGRVDALQVAVDRTGRSVAGQGEQLEALGRQMAEQGQHLDDLSALAPRIDEIETQRADLAERTDRLVEAYVERSSKRYAKAVANYVKGDAAELAEKLARKHVDALRDELVEAQAAAGRRAVPLLPTLLALAALGAAVAGLYFALD